jgi:hypothetical protein
MTRLPRSLSLVLCALAVNAFAQSEDPNQNPKDVPPDTRGIAKLKRFMEICLATPDLEEAGKLIIAEGLVHASKRDKNDPRKMNNDSIRFAFKKAHGNVAMYDPKPRLIRTVLTGTSAVGFGPTAQKGQLYKYFIAKKDGVNGMPAPIQIFYPEGGGEPIVYDFGSF